MKTEPHARQHHEGEPPPESLIHHEEPTLLEQWFRRGLRRGSGFWGTLALLLAGILAVALIAWRVGGPSESGVQAWAELAAVATAPSSMSPFGADPNAGLPERLRRIAGDHPDSAAARWANLRAASLLLNEGSAELATTRRRAGAGKIVEADELFAQLAESSGDATLRRMAVLGLARAAEARMGLDADDTDHAELDDVLALYDRVIDEFPETPEAKQAEALKRRLQRTDSIAFYEQLARYDPNASIPGAPSMPGLNLGPGESSPFGNLFNQPASGTTGGLSGSPFPGLEGSLPLDLSGPDDPTGMPAPVPLPGDSTAPDETDPLTIPVDPAPAPAGTPDPESPRVPDDPFGSSPAGTPVPSAEPAPATPPAEAPAPSGGLPDSVFPSGGPNG